MIEALETRHYVNTSGEYIGGFSGIRRTNDIGEATEEWPDVPAGAIEVDHPPVSALDRWDGGGWKGPSPAAFAAEKAKIAADTLDASPAVVALIEALAPRLSITPAALLAEVSGKLAQR